MNEQNPAHEVVGTITKLSDGYVVTLRGKTYACRNARELGAKVSRECGKLKALPPPPEADHTAQLAQAWESGYRAGASQAGANLSPSEVPEQNSLVPMRAPQPSVDINLQLSNARAAARAKAQGIISADDFLEACEKFAPDLSDDAISGILEESEQERDNQDAGQFVQCSCSGGLCKQVMSIPNPQGLCQACAQGEHLHPLPGQPEIPDSEYVKIIQEEDMGLETNGYVQAEDEEGQEVYSPGAE